MCGLVERGVESEVEWVRALLGDCHLPAGESERGLFTNRRDFIRERGAERGCRCWAAELIKRDS